VVVTSVGSDPASRSFTYRYRIVNHLASGAIASLELDGLVLWPASDPSPRLAPGQTVDGVQLTSRGLPGIRVVEARPADANADGAKPSVLRTRTVGPRAPPATLVPVDVLSYLTTVLDESRQLGWISAAGVHRSLRAKLITARREIDAGDFAAAGTVLTAFLDEVRAASCHDFHCTGREALTSEAHAVLFFNGDLLLELLPYRPPRRRDNLVEDVRRALL
jgi:hypothetical protein